MRYVKRNEAQRGGSDSAVQGHVRARRIPWGNELGPASTDEKKSAGFYIGKTILASDS